MSYGQRPNPRNSGPLKKGETYVRVSDSNPVLVEEVKEILQEIQPSKNPNEAYIARGTRPKRTRRRQRVTAKEYGTELTQDLSKQFGHKGIKTLYQRDPDARDYTLAVRDYDNGLHSRKKLEQITIDAALAKLQTKIANEYKISGLKRLNLKSFAALVVCDDVESVKGIPPSLIEELKKKGLHSGENFCATVSPMQFDMKPKNNSFQSVNVWYIASCLAWDLDSHASPDDLPYMCSIASPTFTYTITPGAGGSNNFCAFICFPNAGGSLTPPAATAFGGINQSSAYNPTLGTGGAWTYFGTPQGNNLGSIYDRWHLTSAEVEVFVPESLTACEGLYIAGIPVSDMSAQSNEFPDGTGTCTSNTLLANPGFKQFNMRTNSTHWGWFMFPANNGIQTGSSWVGSNTPTISRLAGNQMLDQYTFTIQGISIDITASITLVAHMKYTCMSSGATSYLAPGTKPILGPMTNAYARFLRDAYPGMSFWDLPSRRAFALKLLACRSTNYDDLTNVVPDSIPTFSSNMSQGRAQGLHANDSLDMWV